MRPVSALLDDASSMLGPLSPEIRQRIINAIADPGPETWDDVYGVIIVGARMLTMWQAVLKVDPTFPRRAAAGSVDAPLTPVEKWERTPDSLTILNALHHAFESSE